MGRSIPVTIGQCGYTSKTEAAQYFMELCDTVKEAGPPDDGALF